MLLDIPGIGKKSLADIRQAQACIQAMETPIDQLVNTPTASEADDPERPGSLDSFLVQRISPPSNPYRYQPPIEKLNLAPRTMNCLKRAGICYIDDILEMSDAEILQIPGFNRRSLKPLRRSFEEREKELSRFCHGKMDLSPRLLDCLRQARIWYPDNLFYKSDAELLSIPGIGEKLSVEIRQAQKNSGWTGISIDELKLSTGTRKALKAAGIALCESLWQTTNAQLLLLPGLEKKNVGEIRAALNRLSELRKFIT
jgi:DNA-directed RNA polymerase alpha subunit